MNQLNHNGHSSQTVLTTPPAAILDGIDWAENEHEFCAAMPDGTIIRSAFKQKRSTIDQWIAELSAIAPNAPLDVCIETSTGGLLCNSWFVVHFGSFSIVRPLKLTLF